MDIQLKPWGNSQGIRFSKEFLRSLGIAPDEILEVEGTDGQIILRRKTRHRSLRERAAAYDGKLNLSEEMDWGDSVGSEVW